MTGIGFSGIEENLSGIKKEIRQSKSQNFLFLLITIGLLGIVIGWGQPVRAEDDTANPGDTEPLKGNYLFRDDEIIRGTVGYYVNAWAGAPTSDDLMTEWLPTSEGGYNYNSPWPTDPQPTVAAAVGRINNPEYDQHVLGLLGPDGSTKVQLPYMSAQIELRAWTNISNPTQRYIDVATGDFDHFVDENGFYHDEIIVVRSALNDNNGEAVLVDVLDYNFKVIATYDFTGSYRNVAVTLGDFNGDGMIEIAIAMVLPASVEDKYVVTTGKLTYDDASAKYALAFNSTSDHLSWDGISVDITSGDFTGQGTDQIFAAGSNHFYVFETDSDLKLIQKSSTEHSDFDSSSDTKTTIRLATGLFRYDPNNGYDLNRSQIIVSAIKRSKEKLWVRVHLYYIDDTISGPVNTCQYREDLDTHNRGYKKCDLSINAGNFVGHGQDGEAESPTMQIAAVGFGFIDDESNHNLLFEAVWKVSSDMKTISRTGYHSGYGEGDDDGEENVFYDNYQERAIYILAVDSDGDSWRLAPPVQVTMDHIIQLEGMIEEPPKHVDYVPVDDPDENPETEWEVCNIGGFDEFNVETSFTDGNSLESTTETTSSWDIGAAASLDASLTFKAGIPLLGKTKMSGSVEAKAGYQYKASSDDINSLYSEMEAKVVRETNRDDNIGGHLLRIDMWLYPIVGYMTGDDEAPYGYYQVVIPGVVDDTDPASKFESGGFTHGDTYQPLHENHNT